MKIMIARRQFSFAAAAALASAASGCSSVSSMLPDVEGAPRQPSASASNGPRPLTRTLQRPDYNAVYGAWPGEKFPVAAFDYNLIEERYRRQSVEFPWTDAPGSIIVDPASRHLYFVESPGKATRYGVGVGREGFLWSGLATVNLKRDWPDWIPPHEMVERSPEIRAQLEPTSRGMGVRGGSKSPLGARAMYLFAGGRDLGYRIHGTTEPETIGTNVSSGCVRMINQDIAHLYTRASVGTHVAVLA